MTVFKDLFKKASPANKELAKKYKDLYGTPTGKEVLDHILGMTNVAKPSYVPGTTADIAIFNEGARFVGLKILGMLESDLTKDNK